MARPKRGEILSLTIDDLAYGGEGVGRADGYVVFVPGGLPGDRLQVRLERRRGKVEPHRLAARSEDKITAIAEAMDPTGERVAETRVGVETDRERARTTAEANG